MSELIVAEAVKPTCGIVMPISAIDGCDEGHWVEVLAIITDAASAAGFEARLVSQSDEVGVIQKNIIQNLYQNDIVICDVSGKNANVMFELGMRLAFDKPTIIIKDDVTSYSFDTSPVEHLSYPRDLRFAKIVTFKQVLASKIKATCDIAAKNSNYSPFLKHFGDFTVAKIDTREVGAQEFMMSALSDINTKISAIERRSANFRLEAPQSHSYRDRFTIKTGTMDEIYNLRDKIKMTQGVTEVRIGMTGDQGIIEVFYRVEGETDLTRARNEVKNIYDRFSYDRIKSEAQRSQIRHPDPS